MKKFILWTVSALVLMIGCPFLAVQFAGSGGMAVCFILFYAVNPLFCLLCGMSAGKNVKKLWLLPLVTAGMFLAGTWLFFDKGESAFLVYAGCYLAIGIVSMIITNLIKNVRVR